MISCATFVALLTLVDWLLPNSITMVYNFFEFLSSLILLVSHLEKDV